MQKVSLPQVKQPPSPNWSIKASVYCNVTGESTKDFILTHYASSAANFSHNLQNYEAENLNFSVKEFNVIRREMMPCFCIITFILE